MAIEILCMVIIRILIYIVLNRHYPIFWFRPTHGPRCHGLVINIYLVSPLQVSLVVMIIQGWFFFSYLTDFSYFPLFSKCCWIWSEQVKNDLCERGIDGFSYISLISVNLCSNQDYSCIIADHCSNKMRNKKYHTVRTVLKAKKKS